MALEPDTHPLSAPHIVCAANRCGATGWIVPSARHHDPLMNNLIRRIQDNYPATFDPQHEVEGFMDQHGKFYTRTEAWKIAFANGQIARRVGGDSTNGGTLYSENLY